MALQVLEKPCWQEPSLIILTVLSSESVGQNLFKNTSVKVPEWSDNSSSWPDSIHLASFSSIKSTLSEGQEWKDSVATLKSKELC
jgi:hypothetical protein